jgi:hypothetical protein
MIYYTFVLVAEKEGEESSVFCTTPFSEKLIFFYSIKIESISTKKMLIRIN